jgi:site-specific DNA recombinase
METLYYAAYSRVSLDEQRKGISPIDQLRRINEWARNSNMRFELAQYEGRDGKLYPAEFLEDFSGFEYERPEMDIIRELARLSVIDALIVLRTDRFARDEAVFMLLERYFKKQGVKLFSVEEGEFTPGVVNRFVAAFQRAKAEEEATTAKRRMQEARHAYTKAGIPQSQGHPLFGYEKSGKKRDTQYVINEKHTEVVRLIFYLYTEEDYTSTQIAFYLNEHSIPSPGANRAMNKGSASGKWIDRTVMRILKNSAYIGELVGFQHTTVEGKLVARHKEEHVIIPVPPIIDIQVWEQAQYRLTHAKNLWYENRRKKRDYLLAGMCRCSKCGYSMVGRSTTKPNKVVHSYYNCGAESKRFFLEKNCSNRVTTAQLEETVWEFIERLATDPRITVALYEEEHEATETLFAQSQTRIAAIDELLQENSEEQKRLSWMFQKKRCDEQYFDAEYDRLDQERTALERERGKAERLLKRQEASGRQIEELEAIGQEIREAAGNLSFKRKRHILERLRLHITVPPLSRTAQRPIEEERDIVIEVLGHATGVRLKRRTPS